MLMPVANILIVSLVFFLIAALNFYRTGQKPTPWHLLILLALALVFTGASLLITSEGGSGTGWRVQRGWPHFFYTSWSSIEDNSRFNGFSFGSLGVYALSNVVAYFAALLLIASVTIRRAAETDS